MVDLLGSSVGTVSFPRVPFSQGEECLEMSHVIWDPSIFIEMN